jgi:imidazolonepropionase-like amidohydrolase
MKERIAALKIFATVVVMGGLLGMAALEAGVSRNAGAPPRDDGVYAFVNVTVIPMDAERVLRRHTVVVERGRITAVGPADVVEIPANATRIDGVGKYLIPGLSEMHGHTPVPGGDPNNEFVENMMFLYAANGVTTVRGMLGAPGQLELKGMTNSGEMIGPTLYLAGPSFNGNSVSSPAEAAERVRQQKREGWDLLKVHPGLTRAEYDSMALAAAEVGIRFGGHVPEPVGLLHALKMGQQTFDHIDGFIAYLDAADKSIDETKLRDIVRLTKEAGAWVVPTQVLWEVGVLGLGNTEEFRRRPEMRYWPQQGNGGVDRWAQRHSAVQSNPNFDVELRTIHARNRNRVLKALVDGGVGILMGTDSPQMFSVPGFSLHREMQAMVDAGMTPYQVLESGTKNVGEYFQAQDSFGTVAIGRRADLILLNSNPLQNIASVADRAGVMVRGRWIPESEIQSRLERIATAFAGGE